METPIGLSEILSAQQPVDRTAMHKAIAEAENKGRELSGNKSFLRQILSLIDLTTLEGKDTEKKVQAFCRKAKEVPSVFPGLPTVAAVCIYPALVETARKELQGTTIQVASVATGFPSGQLPLFLKAAEVKYAIEQGADEIDMVISRGKFLSGEYQAVYDEIKAIKDVCGNKLLKVILETGELENMENIRLASDIAIAAGADFIKTSTGKIPQGASLEAVYVMLQAIRAHYKKTGRMVGIKPSGGISNAETAAHYIVLTETILGKQWINNRLMRFGASSLAGNVLKLLTEEKNAAYFSSDSGY
ncbi:MAG: deoxyribose-phosphate aldolase [Flavobacteriia bacterium]|nr:deoxyribose-phosphate aldolase [Flavobacteriia bacterium]OJX36129.1 MAG: deoxyribose-phosphate aldolase [Flavobacteriia bacterium 40-80]